LADRKTWTLPPQVLDPANEKFAKYHVREHDEHERLFPVSYDNKWGDLSTEEELIVIPMCPIGGHNLMRLGVMVNTTLTSDPNNYWKFQWKKYTGTPRTSNLIGSIMSTQVLSLTAFTPVSDVYNTGLSDGDTLVLSASKVGSPGTLSGLVVFAQPYQRI